MPPPACAVRREPGAPSRVRLCCGADHAFRRVAVRRVLREGDEQGAALPGQALRGRLDGYGGLSYDEPRDHEIEVRLNDGGVGAGTPTLRRVWVWRAIADRYFARQLDDLCRCAGCTGCAGTPAATPARPPARPPARRSAKARLFREALRRKTRRAVVVSRSPRGGDRDSARCSATTRSGARCRRAATLGGGGACWQHRSAAAPPPPPAAPLETCPICLETILEPLRLGCGHAFHRRCIRRWASASVSGSAAPASPSGGGGLASPTCPICRESFDAEDLEEEWSPPRVLVVRQRRRIRLRPLAIAM